MTKPVILAIYGAGGHRAEMVALLRYLQLAPGEFDVVSLGQGELPMQAFAHYPAADIRSKHSRLKNLIYTLPLMFSRVFTTLSIIRRHKPCGVVSTGPGLCVLPMLVCRMFNVKTVFVETCSRFNSRSMTGKVMSRLAHRFLVQNKELLALYPNAQYCGRL